MSTYLIVTLCGHGARVTAPGHAAACRAYLLCHPTRVIGSCAVFHAPKEAQAQPA